MPVSLLVFFHLTEIYGFTNFSAEEVHRQKTIYDSDEILDHIFSFLPHRETLIACSKDVVLFPIVARHLYHHLIVHFGKERINSNHGATFEPDHLSKLVSKNPGILRYVRVLQIECEPEQSCGKVFDDFADTLLQFPVLECIMLRYYNDWDANAFREALEDRLSLRTVKEVHLRCLSRIPISMLDNLQHVKNLSVTGTSCVDQFCASALPQLQSLELSTRLNSPSLLAWVKAHIKELRSLKCLFSARRVKDFLELLEVCSGTLESLDVDLEGSSCCRTYICARTIDEQVLPELPLPLNLKQLTLRAGVQVCREEDGTIRYITSWLPAVAKAVNSIVSSPRHLAHLVIDVRIHVTKPVDITLCDFSPLCVLGVAASLSTIPLIDLYVHTSVLPPDLIRATVMRSLERCEEVVRSMKEGVLVVHTVEGAPGCVLRHSMALSRWERLWNLFESSGER